MTDHSALTASWFPWKLTLAVASSSLAWRSWASQPFWLLSKSLTCLMEKYVSQNLSFQIFTLTIPRLLPWNPLLSVTLQVNVVHPGILCKWATSGRHANEERACFRSRYQLPACRSERWLPALIVHSGIANVIVSSNLHNHFARMMIGAISSNNFALYRLLWHHWQAQI